MFCTSEANNKQILDYTVDENVGDQKMELAMGGDFCRKCGMKMCRCVDYTQDLFFFYLGRVMVKGSAHATKR